FVVALELELWPGSVNALPGFSFGGVSCGFYACQTKAKWIMPS
ncbi:MAG: hypothetical protein RL082_1239, partial [Pseudomonadota bacterium]